MNLAKIPTRIFSWDLSYYFDKMGGVKISRKKIVYKIIDNLGALLLFSMLIICFYQVISRYVLNTPLAWTEQTAVQIFIWLAMIGSFMAMIKGEHVSIDIIYSKLPLSAKRIAHLINNIIIAFVLCVVCVNGLSFAQLNSSQYSPTVAWLSMYWVYLALPVGSFLMFLWIIKDTFCIFSTNVKTEKGSDEIGS